MDRTLSYTISEDEKDISVKEYLNRQGISNSVLAKLKKSEDGIEVNGKREFTSYSLKSGDLLCLHWREDKISDSIIAVAEKINIVFEDEDIVVADKPCGMPVHPSSGNRENTLGNRLAYYYSGNNFVYRPLYRLDKDTTGLVLVSKNGLSSSMLTSMQKNNEIRRTYFAIVSGIVKKEGSVNAPIGRCDGSIIKRCVDFEKGSSALTHFKPVLCTKNLTLLEIWLESGRTHQIRVHMSYIGHPLVGDFLYHPDFSLIHRHALHAGRIRFCHPVTKKKIEIESGLPEDMKKVLREE